jgi:hypothetical protein
MVWTLLYQLLDLSKGGKLRELPADFQDVSSNPPRLTSTSRRVLKLEFVERVVFCLLRARHNKKQKSVANCICIT